jgi:putative aldouronate transport system substrate-binding protein
MKKTIALVGVLLVISTLSLFAAGSQEDDGAATAGSVAEPVGRDGDSWTWDTSEFEIDNWYVGVPWFSKTWDVENCMNDRVMYERTGLRHVNFTTPASKKNEKLNAMIAAGNLPDVITIPAKFPQVPLLMKEGRLVEDLSQLMEEYAPTFTSKVPPSWIKWWTTEDGHWYGFPNAIQSADNARADGEFDITTNFGFIGREDVLSDLGLTAENFTTQDGMVEALKAIKEANITADGASVYPFMLSTFGGAVYDGLEQLAMQIGMVYEDTNGDYVFPPENPKFREMMLFLNRLYREDLLDMKNLIMQKKEQQELLSQRRVITYLGTTSKVGRAYQNLCDATNGEIQYIPLGPLHAQDGTPAAYRATSLGAWCLTFVTKDAENKHRIVRFLEYLFSDEGAIQQEFGTEGVTYRYMDNGKIDFTDQYRSEFEADTTAAVQKYGLDTMWFISDGQFLKSITYEIPFEAMSTVDQMKQVIDDHKQELIYIDNYSDPAVVTPAAGSEAATILAKMKVYLDEQLVKVIVAETESEAQSLFDEAIAKLDSMGMEQVSEVMNENFWARKRKLDVTYSIPEDMRLQW